MLLLSEEVYMLPALRSTCTSLENGEALDGSGHDLPRARKRCRQQSYLGGPDRYESCENAQHVLDRGHMLVARRREGYGCHSTLSFVDPGSGVSVSARAPEPFSMGGLDPGHTLPLQLSHLQPPPEPCYDLWSAVQDEGYLSYQPAHDSALMSQAKPALAAVPCRGTDSPSQSPLAGPPPPGTPYGAPASPPAPAQRGSASSREGTVPPRHFSQSPSPVGPMLTIPGALPPSSAAASVAKVEAVLARHKQSFCQELGVPIARGGGVALWQWFCASVLSSARIKSSSGARACQALFGAGLCSPQALAGVSHAALKTLLFNAGYERYNAKAASFLLDDARQVLADYGGDLGRLRQAASRAPLQERALLKKFKGIGDGGVDIFFREAQLAWTEVYPFADKKALKAARLVGLPAHPAALAQLCGDDREKYVRVVAGLVRIELVKGYAEFLEIG